MSTGFLFDPQYLLHHAGSGHPESPARLSSVLSHLEQIDWFKALKKITPRLAEEEWLAEIHELSYLRRARETCEAGYPYLDTPDVGISEISFEIARLAAGGALNLADSLMRGDIHNGFALLRPPGHHAEAGQALGFCLFNNAAVLARYLQKKYGLGKILILDWDVHHGNGTQHCFEEDPSVFYISLHQFPFYPGTGAWHETGVGRGKGATLNCPMPAGAGDGDYFAAFMDQIIPRVRDYRPEFILISAGFDAHAEDPLGGIHLSTECFSWMTKQVMELAALYSGGRILSLLEGGYNLRYLPLCIEKHLAALSGHEQMLKSF